MNQARIRRKLKSAYTKIFGGQRDAVPDIGDISFNIGRFNLSAPQGHLLPRVLRSHPGYAANLGRLAGHLCPFFDQNMMLDVGANIGDSAAIVRNASEDIRIICIEGSDEYYPYLERNTQQIGEVELIKAYVGEKDEEIEAQLNTGLGTLQIRHQPGSVLQIQTLDSLATIHRNIQKVNLIKTDTDGYDLRILRGGLNLIKRCTPVLFFEYDAVYFDELEEDGPGFLRLLRDMGYQTIIFYDNYGRLIAMTGLGQTDTLESLLLYIKDKKGMFQYYDVCVFHNTQEPIAASFFESEKTYYHAL
jgi:FkbM family methyltransferase